MVMSALLPITEISSAFIIPVVEVYASDTEEDTEEGTEEEEDDDKIPDPVSGLMEDILKGLSKFTYKGFHWNGLSVGNSAFNLAQKIYTKKSGKKPLFWNDNNKEEMQNFYSSTHWDEFEGMYETLEMSNSCKAILTEEVLQYESLLDKAAEDNGFRLYKELFKAIAQTRFNEHKVEYETAKDQGLIEGKGSDSFDLFGIDGSWIDGGKTPVGEALAPTPTVAPIEPPEQTPDEGSGEEGGFVIATPTPLPTPMPESEPESAFEKDNKSLYSVSESINLAAKVFSDVLENAVYPSPYNTNSLISLVEGFEFGGSSSSIKQQFNKSSVTLLGYNKFISFTSYYENEYTSDDDSLDEDAVNSIIEKYAKKIADGETRASSEVYGKYKYSDQKFYEKVFENYKCTSGGSINYGELPADMKDILKQCMATWDSKVTKQRKEIIQQGVLLYGVTYSMDKRNAPSIDSPTYLDCSSFVGQCYWRAGLTARSSANWTTGNTSSNFSKISESSLIPGDIGQKCWPGSPGGSDHIGIYIGTVNGVKYWLHCTGGTTDGVYHAPGKGIKINNYGGFNYYGKFSGL